MNPNSSISADKTSGNDRAGRGRDATVTASTSELTKEAKHIAGDLAGQARRSGEVQMSRRKDRAAQGLDRLAHALRQTGDNMKSQEEENALTDYVVRASDKVEEASRYLERRTVGQIVGDLEGFARREPTLFLGGAFVVGLLGGRFLKSSRPVPTTRRFGGTGPENGGNRQMPGQGGSSQELGEGGPSQSGYGQSAMGQSGLRGGSTQQGQRPLGQSPLGQRAPLQSPLGQSPLGQRMQGQPTQGQPTQGQPTQGQTTQGQTTQGQTMQNKDKPAEVPKPTPVIGGYPKPGAV